MSAASKSFAGRPVAASAPAAMFLACAWIAAGASLAGAPPPVAALFALPVLFAGAAFPLLVAASPPEPSALKLALLSWLLAPWVLAALYALGRMWLAPERSLAAALGVAGALQLAVLRRKFRFEPPGRAAWLALAGSATLGALVFALHLAAPLLRTMGDGVWHAGLIAATGRELSPSSPWLAGTDLHHPSAFHLLGELFQRVLGVAPTAALTWLAAWAATALPLALYFLAAPLWSGGRAALAAVLCGTLGWNAAGGLLWLGRGLPWWPAADGARWLARSELALPAGEPALPLAGSWELLLPGPFPLALAAAAGAWLCAAHALRHAGRPWVALTGILHGLALLLDPGVGLAAMAATGAAALAAPGLALARPAVLLSLLICALPGLAALRGGTGLGPVLGELARPGLPTALWGAALLALAALPALGVVRGARASVPGRRSIALLLVAGALLALLLGLTAELPGALPGGALRLSGLALGVLAGGGLAQALEGRGARRLFAWLTALPLAAGASLTWSLGLRTHLALAAVQPDFRELPFALEPLERRARDLAREPGTLAVDPVSLAIDANVVGAYRYLREGHSARRPAPILLLGERREEERLFASPRPHPAPLYSGLDLWADRSEPSARAHPRLLPRVQKLRDFLAGRPHSGPPLLVELERLGRPAILWLDPADLRRAPLLAHELPRLRFTLLHESGDIRLYHWTPPSLRSD